MNAWLSDRKDVFGDAVDRPAAPLGRAGVRMGPPHSRPAQAPAPPSRETDRQVPAGQGVGYLCQRGEGAGEPALPSQTRRGPPKRGARGATIRGKSGRCRVKLQLRRLQLRGRGPGVCRPGGRRKQTKVASEALCAAAFLKKGKTRGLKRKKKKKRQEGREGGREEGGREGEGRRKIFINGFKETKNLKYAFWKTDKNKWK